MPLYIVHLIYLFKIIYLYFIYKKYLSVTEAILEQKNKYKMS